MTDVVHPYNEQPVDSRPVGMSSYPNELHSASQMSHQHHNHGQNHQHHGEHLHGTDLLNKPEHSPWASSPDSESGESLVCQWQGCSRFFAGAEDLYDHMCKDHVGRKSTHNLSLTCKWGDCRVTTIKRDHITSHIRIHIPFKPYKCSLCNKNFKRPQDLKKHERVHGESAGGNSPGAAHSGSRNSSASSPPIYHTGYASQASQGQYAQHNQARYGELAPGQYSSQPGLLPPPKYAGMYGPAYNSGPETAAYGPSSRGAGAPLYPMQMMPGYGAAQPPMSQPPYSSMQPHSQPQGHDGKMQSHNPNSEGAMMTRKRALDMSLELFEDVKRSRVTPEYSDPIASRLSAMSSLIYSPPPSAYDLGRYSPLQQDDLLEADDFLSQLSSSITHTNDLFGYTPRNGAGATTLPSGKGSLAVPSTHSQALTPPQSDTIQQLSPADSSSSHDTDLYPRLHADGSSPHAELGSRLNDTGASSRIKVGLQQTGAPPVNSGASALAPAAPSVKSDGVTSSSLLKTEIARREAQQTLQVIGALRGIIGQLLARNGRPTVAPAPIPGVVLPPIQPLPKYPVIN